MADEKILIQIEVDNDKAQQSLTEQTRKVELLKEANKKLLKENKELAKQGSVTAKQRAENSKQIALILPHLKGAKPILLKALQNEKKKEQDKRK